MIYPYSVIVLSNKKNLTTIKLLCFKIITLIPFRKAKLTNNDRKQINECLEIRRRQTEF